MYHRILVALENSRADAVLVSHVTALAKQFGSELLIMHVADGWAARHFNDFNLAESSEMKADRAYLDEIAGRLRADGLAANAALALGNPPTEIVKMAEERSCDLIALASHGHKFLADIFMGSTVDRVRHNTAIPVLVVRAKT